TGMAVAHAHVHQPMPPLPPDVPAQLVPLVERLTAKDPADRPASAAEVAGYARHLRDTLRGNRTLRLPVMHPGWEPFSSQGSRPGTDGSGRHRTPNGVEAGLPGAGFWRRRARERTRPRSQLVIPLAILAIAVLAGLVGWQLKGVLGAGQGRPASHAT